MKLFKPFALVAMLLLAVSVGFSQTNTITVTYLSAAVQVADTQIVVNSATDISASPQTTLVIEKEAMTVKSVSSTTIQVSRQNPSYHASGQNIYVGRPNWFKGTNPRSLGCTTASEYAYPWVNATTGDCFYCLSSAWTAANPISTALTMNKAVTGTVRQIHGQLTTYSSMTSGNLVPVRGATAIPAAATVSGSYLYGVQGTLTVGAGVTYTGTALAGVYGRMDFTGATAITVGNNAPLQSNIVGVASGTWSGIQGIYVESAGGGIINSFFRAFGKSTYVFDLESNVHNQMSTTCTPSAVTGATGGLKILVDGTVKWIPLAATCS